MPIEEAAPVIEVMKPILISARAAWVTQRHKLAAKRAAPILERLFDINTSWPARSRPATLPYVAASRLGRREGDVKPSPDAAIGSSRLRRRLQPAPPEHAVLAGLARSIPSHGIISVLTGCARPRPRSPRSGGEVLRGQSRFDNDDHWPRPSRRAGRASRFALTALTRSRTSSRAKSAGEGDAPRTKGAVRRLTCRKCP